ncbi:T-cell surface glycoprotein CD5 isoform X2 [Myxocyprinus asiaticus]|uniref:T-cell surface glycoprotein CD5 isoform X2 n=1 Tax=Myxocyprinus asiaticus TaxID=70543 RepID=UPI002223B2D4|nr:T-cell surface glycoprotein CD5 isoform X2 [Myxocyprinus asiaticus]
MENSLLVTLTALLLLGVREGISSTTTVNSSPNPSIPSTLNPSAAPSSCTPQTPCRNITQYITLPPVVARVKMYWKQESHCEGQLYLSFFQQRDVPLCFSSHMASKWWNDLCKDRRCGDFEGLKPTEETKGYLLSSNMSVSNASCSGVRITCQDTLGRELAAYKAVTGILLFLILSVILLQFGRPTYKAIRKRFSQKRQNRWIGPTQSQSVSYHRGQAGGNPNNNTLKGQSFPGLERLTVNPSREPSSNRNSDYDSYGYN